MEANQSNVMNPVDNQVIKNQASYEHYVRIKDAPILHLPDRLISTSQTGTQIDPNAHISAIMKRIKLLPKDEQHRILIRVKAIKVLTNKVANLRQQAFGIKKPIHYASLSMGLLDERSSELIEYFGRMLSAVEVHEIVCKKWGYDVSIETIRAFKKTNAIAISERVAQFQSDYSDIRLTHKKGRVEELVYLYNVRKQKFSMTQTARDHELMMKTLRAIKDEVEGTSMRIDHHISGKLQITIDYAVQEQVMQGMTINDIIIARVAARTKVNPTFILSRLHDSFYAKHSGFVRPDSNLDEQEIIYPSSIVYNWNDIEKQHKNVGDTGIQEAKWEEVGPTEQTIGSNIKDQLMEKLGIKQQRANSTSIQVQNNTTDID